MFDTDDDAKGDYRRIDRSTGSAGERRWSADERAVIVAESDVPGRRVSDVARRWRLRPQQLYQWRHIARLEATGGLKPGAMPDFVPIVTDPGPAVPACCVGSAPSVIEVRLAGAVVRVVSGLDDAQLTAVLRAVRASAARS
jgi:transposase